MIDGLIHCVDCVCSKYSHSFLARIAGGLNGDENYDSEEEDEEEYEDDDESCAAMDIEGSRRRELTYSSGSDSAVAGGVYGLQEGQQQDMEPAEEDDEQLPDWYVLCHTHSLCNSLTQSPTLLGS